MCLRSKVKRWFRMNMLFTPNQANPPHTGWICTGPVLLWGFPLHFKTPVTLETAPPSILRVSVYQFFSRPLSQFQPDVTKLHLGLSVWMKGRRELCQIRDQILLNTLSEMLPVAVDFTGPGPMTLGWLWLHSCSHRPLTGVGWGSWRNTSTQVA